MNFTTKNFDDIFMKAIFNGIRDAIWNNFAVVVSFKGRTIEREVGGGIDVRDFKVEVIEQEDIEYVSPRDKMIQRHLKNEAMEAESRKKGSRRSGEILKRKWAMKRRLEALKGKV